MERKIEKKWYMIHTYSSYEKKVKADLEKRIQTLELTDKVFRIVVPEEEIKEIKNGKEKIVFRKLFPGYVMIEMEAVREETNDGIWYSVDSDAWYVIRNTNGVTGFVGIGSDPIPMEDEEVATILRFLGEEGEEKPEPKEEIILDFKAGDMVELLEGGFAGSVGEVNNIDLEHGKVKIMIDMFGRMTPVEIGVNEVKKVMS
ncbi:MULTISPECIES: transcription termination/antitermination protein NusG [Psychrilyobacter]|uniref:Transcription termination/antitermination protein NusG n=1 Tax=Psychrilyobacter piezotolerans TaxID=2293438 RepID=A0ABX9KE47_9FUSO|nr:MULTISPECIES: transcription termination/antitermination protein NusG [Psychrilyobacter]MCS5422713.1 transcription termination/antitermination protein NusG [Psychrilyobacter sp. S5]NDI78983.1 transcription termination/antitermination factor NusG [Psychrilyobacter piezotolerans]RDE59204.1 transcription termination/antitermination factor NusG [Psychrilyobacter sp. S5]REI39771.1 transcription termination/antitermination factor NusG [Psychrilyobacter piezotolerans]